MIIQPLVTMYVSHLMGRMDESVVKAAGIIFSLAGIAGIIAAPFWGKRGQQLGYTKVLCFVFILCRRYQSVSDFCAGYLAVCRDPVRIRFIPGRSCT